jgi:hypothetical protein
MATRGCPGLPADWLDAWLAAVGATVLVQQMTLAWSADPVPQAVLSVPDDDPADRIGSSLPSAGDLESWPIARRLHGHAELEWDVEVATFRDRAALARRSTAAWTLSALYTDLSWDRTKRAHVIGRGQFATPMPGRDNTIADRLRKLIPAAREADVRASLDGRGTRVVNNGLGFDVERVGSLADESKMLVDPLIELLAFYALALFPVRGDGRTDARQRGWTGRRGQTGAFRWPAWTGSLDAMGIDALLDYAGPGAERLGVTGWWQVVPFEQLGPSTTRAYGSMRSSP